MLDSCQEYQIRQSGLMHASYITEKPYLHHQLGVAQGIHLGPLAAISWHWLRLACLGWPAGFGSTCVWSSKIIHQFIVSDCRDCHIICHYFLSLLERAIILVVNYSITCCRTMTFLKYLNCQREKERERTKILIIVLPVSKRRRYMCNSVLAGFVLCVRAPDCAGRWNHFYVRDQGGIGGSY